MNRKHAGAREARPSATGRRGPRRTRILRHAVLGMTALVWISPLAYALYTALRPYADTAANGYVSFAHRLGFTNFRNAWVDADLPRYYLNTLIVAVPAIVLTLLLGSMVAFAASRAARRVNVALLIFFTAGNLLPPQVIITPLYRLFLAIPLPAILSETGTMYDSYTGIIVIHVAFQVGFCVFVLSNYIRTIPVEITEAASVDGASLWRQYWQIILPLCRAPLGALATLEFTWIYNDFFWALVLMPTGERRPITSALAGLQGQYFTDNNLTAAASLLAALPTVIVFVLLQRHFVGGLTLGAVK